MYGEPLPKSLCGLGWKGVGIDMYKAMLYDRGSKSQQIGPC